MVEDRVTEPRRIAQLLSSELTGLERGILSRVSVVDADPDAEPSPDGTLAYRIALDQEARGQVLLSESAVAVVLPNASDGIDDASGSNGPAVAERDDLAVTDRDDGVELRVTSGAAVKAAVDLVVAAFENRV